MADSASVTITCDAGSSITLDPRSRVLTASSVLFFGHDQDARPALAKVSLLAARELAHALPAAEHMARDLFAAVADEFDAQCTCGGVAKEAVMPRIDSGTSLHLQSQSSDSLYSLGASSAHASAAARATCPRCSGAADDAAADARASVQHEVAVHAHLKQHHHPHPPHVVDPLRTVVLPLATLGGGRGVVLPRHRPLQPDTRIPKLPLRELAQLAHDLTKALAAAHAAGVVHCDVSAANLVVHCSACEAEGRNLDESCPHAVVDTRPGTKPARRYALIDFGLAQRIEEAVTSRHAVAAGTPGYVPPEILSLRELQSPTGTQFELTGLSHSSRAPSVASLGSPALLAQVPPHLLVPPLEDMTISELSSLASSPPSDRGLFFSTAHALSGMHHQPAARSTPSSPRITPLPAASHSTPSSPMHAPGGAATPWRALRRRLAAARDLYSAGCVVGLLASPYLPLCDLDHLGSPGASPEYVRAHICPRLRSMRGALADALAPGHAQVLQWLVDLLLRCLAHSPRARPTARKILAKHPLCAWVRVLAAHDAGSSDASQPVDLPAYLADCSAWRASQEHARVRAAMEMREQEWDGVSAFELETADAVAESAESESECCEYDDIEGSDCCSGSSAGSRFDSAVDDAAADADPSCRIGADAPCGTLRRGSPLDSRLV